MNKTHEEILKTIICCSCDKVLWWSFKNTSINRKLSAYTVYFCQVQKLILMQFQCDRWVSAALHWSGSFEYVVTGGKSNYRNLTNANLYVFQCHYGTFLLFSCLIKYQNVCLNNKGRFLPFSARQDFVDKILKYVVTYY